MVKRVVEIEDTLEEDIDTMKEAIKEDFLAYVEENLDIGDFEEYYQDRGVDNVSETADNLAIYDKSDEYYLYSRIMDDAFEGAGLGIEKTPENAYYCLMEQEGFEFMNELKVAVEDWIQSPTTEDLDDGESGEPSDDYEPRTYEELEQIVNDL